MNLYEWHGWKLTPIVSVAVFWFLTVQAAAIWKTLSVTGGGSVSAAASSPSHGITLAVVVILGSAALLLAVRLGAIQLIRRVGRRLLSATGVNRVLHWDRYWMFYNGMGCGLATVIAVELGTQLSVYAAAGLLAVMVLWDEFAVRHSDAMLDLAKGVASPLLPNVLVFPEYGQYRLNLPQLFEDVDTGEDSEAELVLGVGDLAFPAIGAVVLVHGLGLGAAIAWAIGGAIGLLLLLSTVLQTDRPHPGLPTIIGGASGGVVVWLVVVTVV